MNNEKIGNYIHWKYGNYKKYGLGTDKTNFSGAVMSQALKQQKAIILQDAKNKKNIQKLQAKEQLENQLNFFFNQNNTVSLVPDISNQDLHNAIINKIQSRFGDLVTVDQNLQASISDATINQNFGKLKEGGKTNSIVAVYNRIAYIKKYFDSMIAPKISNGNKLSKNQSKIQQGFSQIITDFTDIFNNLDIICQDFLTTSIGHNFDPNLINTIKTEKIEINRLEKTFQQTIYRGKGSKTNFDINFVKLLNDIVKRVNRASAAYYTGLAGEMYVALVLQIGHLATLNQVNNLLDEFESGLIDNKIGLVGQNTSYSAMNKNRFVVTGKTKVNHFTSFSNDNNTIQLKATQDKVDVVISLNNGEQLNASVKNYNLSTGKNITLLSGTNMLKYLTNYPIFANHYLNITATTLSESIDKKNYSYRDLIPQGLIAEANKTLLLTLVLKALAGGVEKLSLDKSGFSNNMTADVFIINDNSKGKFRVFFIEDIINTIMSNYNNILNYVEMDGFSENYRPSMNWVTKNKNGARNFKDAYSRINNLLSQFETQKIHISLTQKIFSHNI